MSPETWVTLRLGFGGSDGDRRRHRLSLFVDLDTIVRDELIPAAEALEEAADLQT